MGYGNKLNPERSLRKTRGIKGTKQKIIVTHVIIPATVNLSLNIELSSKTDAKRTLVSNIGKAIVKKLAVKFEGNEI